MEKIAYLNYAATSFPKSRIALESFYKSACSLPEGARQHRPGSYLQGLKERAAKILQIDASAVFFTESATIGLNQVIRGFVKEQGSIAIDNRSHNAVIKPWASLKDQAACMLAEIYDEEDRFLEKILLGVLAKSPRLFCLSHVSNVNGSIYPVEKIIGLIRSHSPSTAVLVDASQSAGAIPLDALRLADFAVFPSHKHLHSLPGAAILIAKMRLEPLIHGGTGSHSISEKESLFQEAGTPNFPAIAAMVDSLEYATENGEMHRQIEDALALQLIEGVGEIDGLRLVGRRAGDNRAAIVALRCAFGSPELHWIPFLRSQNIIARGGLHCSPHHHQQLGLSQSGTLRLSLGWDSKPEHVCKVLNCLNEFSNIARRMFHDSTL